MKDHSEFFGEFGFGEWWGGRRRRGRWRLFERGDLKFVILRLVSEEPMHGYQVMQALEEEAGPWYKPSPGSVYPTLQMLEDEGLVRCEAQDGKKIYEITDEGRAYLEEHGDVVDKIFKRVGSFAEGVFGRHSRELTGSFSRLASVVLETTLTGRTSPEEAEKISRILDRAREEIEGIMRAEEDEDSSKASNDEAAGAATEEAEPEEETGREG